MYKEVILPLSITVLGGVLVILIIWLIKKFAKKIISPMRQIQYSYKVHLDNYKKQLNKDTLRIHHPWMKEGQTLEDILIPVSVHIQHTSNIMENFQKIFINILMSIRSWEIPRIVIIGPPGSGKTVTMRLSAKLAWSIKLPESNDKLVPVLITFSDLRKTNFEIEKAIKQSFKKRGFYSNSEKAGEDIEHFIKNHLYSGKILLLIDGLDELEIRDRTMASNTISQFLSHNSNIPAIMSCRIAAYNGQFDSLKPIMIHMADFSPMAIKTFVQNWSFQPPKSGADLWITIRDNIHLRELAKNPLMLTIIAYLYSHPKYRLPENRALFYEVCIRALLEEWDQAMNPERANKFDRPHKEYLLSNLASNHLSGPNPEMDIDYRDTLKRFMLWLDELGIKKSENKQILEEIIYNSGLLNFIPPIGLRFPHQTFLEFFAALHLLNDKAPEYLINIFNSDPQRWREVLLLYLGLNSNMENSKTIINYLLQTEKIELMVDALCDTRISSPQLAEKILKKAKEEIMKNPSPNLIKSMGILSSNSHLVISKKIHKILLLRLKNINDLTKNALQELIISVLRYPTQEALSLVLNNYEYLNLQRIITEIGDKAIIIVHGLVTAPNITVKKKREIIEGLKQATNIEILSELLRTTEDDEIRYLSSTALVRLSSMPDFWDYISSKEVPLIKKTLIDDSFGWPFKDPSNENGKRLIFLICKYFIMAQKKNFPNTRLSEDNKQIHPRFHYLLNLFNRPPKGTECLTFKKFHSVDSLNNELSNYNLHSIWKFWCDKNMIEKYNKYCKIKCSKVPVFLFIAFISNISIWLWSMVSVISHYFYNNSLLLDYPLNISILAFEALISLELAFMFIGSPSFKKNAFYVFGGGPIMNLFYILVRYGKKISIPLIIFIHSAYFIIVIVISILFINPIIFLFSIIYLFGWFCTFKILLYRFRVRILEDLLEYDDREIKLLMSKEYIYSELSNYYLENLYELNRD